MTGSANIIYIQLPALDRSINNLCILMNVPLHFRLFNKQSILELLLGKRTDTAAYSHIESMRDVVELELTLNRLMGEGSSPYVCPVTGVEMNGKYR